MKKVFLEALDLVFIPKQIASQVVLAVALETSMVRSLDELLATVHFMPLILLTGKTVGHSESNLAYLPFYCR